jgi:hypothetical protein
MRNAADQIPSFAKVCKQQPPEAPLLRNQLEPNYFCDKQPHAQYLFSHRAAHFVNFKELFLKERV